MARRHIVPEVLLLKRAAIAALLAGLIAGGAACDLFEARKPNDPGSNTFPCAPLDNQDNVFTNIQFAFGRGDGLTCYFSTLDNVFTFHPDPTDSLEAPPGKFDNWTKTVEQQVVGNIAGNLQNTSDQIKITYKGTYEPVTTTSDLEIRRYTYEVLYRGKSIPDTLFQGIAEITIQKSGTGQWLVTNWVDRRDPAGTTTRTWGYLRVFYRI